MLGLFWAILGLFWAPGSQSNHLMLQPDFKALRDHLMLRPARWILGASRRIQGASIRTQEDPGGAGGPKEHPGGPRRSDGHQEEQGGPRRS